MWVFRAVFPMTYEEEIEHRWMEDKMGMAKEIIESINIAFERYDALNRKLEEDKWNLNRKGFNSGFDEAIHEISKDLTLQIIRENKDILERLKSQILSRLLKSVSEE